MPANMFVGFVVTAFIGVAFLALILKLLEYDGQPAAQEAKKRIPEAAVPAETMTGRMPAFFGRPNGHAVPLGTLGFDDQMVAFVQSHIQSEQAVVHEFIHLPSIDSLYREARPKLTMH